VSGVRILRLAAGGDGVGRLDDGMTVFVPRSAPGDLVELTGLRRHRRFARARIGRVLEEGPERTVPRCPHYVRDDCGGCQLQHLDGSAQRHARAGFVGEALRRMARVEMPDPAVVPAPDDWGYRSKLTLHVAPDRGRIGLHPFDQPDRLFELEWCHITDARLMELWRRVRRRRELLPEGLERLVLRLDRESGLHVVAIVAGTTAWNDAAELRRSLVADGSPATLWWQPEGGAARTVAGSGQAFPATVFEQVHPAMGDRARLAAFSALGDVAGRHVWDLYAGIGETTRLLLDGGASVESVESDARAVRLADARGPSPADRVRRHAGRVEDILATLSAPALVITNPPRIGMDERAAAALRQRRPARIVYISCDPATLARDIVRLGDAFRVHSVEAFDLFPQTAHVESVTVLDAA
jgi:23S rRNA (uracil1939-C5)-methyltransferase